MDRSGSIIGRCCALVILLLFAITRADANDMKARVFGEALDLESSEPLYTETHCVSDDSLIHEVIYKNAEQNILAHKVLDYSDGPLVPSFVQQNFYPEEMVTVEFNDNQLSMTVKGVNSSVAQRSAIRVSQSNMPLVIDAGFDAFVRQNWNGLVAGEAIPFQFPLAARERLIELRISAAPCSYDGNGDQCFTLEVDHWLLSMLAAPIELGYDVELKQLTRFRGLSNIGDGKGSGLSVDIHYRYQDIPDVCTMNSAELSAGAVRDDALVLRTLGGSA